MRSILFVIISIFLLLVVCAAQIIPIGAIGRGVGATGPWSPISISQPGVINNGCSPACPAVTITTPAALGNLVVAFAYANNTSSSVKLSGISGLGTWAFPPNCSSLQVGGLVGDVSCAWVVVNSITGCTSTCQITPTLSANTSSAVQFVFREYHLASGTIGIENVPTGITSTACGGASSPCNAPAVTTTGSSDLVISAIASEGTSCSPAAPFGNFVNPFGEGSADRINTTVGTGASFNQQTGAVTCLGTNTNLNAAMITVAFTNEGTTSISLLKTGPNSFSSANQTITYNFLIQNTGNTTLNGTFNITDAKIGNVSGCGGTNNNTNISLPPGVTASCNENYLTTVNDFNNPPITNTAQAALGALQSNPSTAMVPLASGMSIDITSTNNPNYGGAKCDGTTDDTNNIQRTLNYASNNNIPTVTAPANVTCRMRTYLGCPRPGDTDNHCGPTGCGFGSGSCGCLNWGTCNIQFPSNVTFKGGAGTIIDGDGIPAINMGTHLVTWKNTGNPYKINNVTHGDTSITLTNIGDASNFKAGDYIAWYYWRPSDSQCGDQNDCDVVPMQVEQVNQVSGAQLIFNPGDLAARTWHNGDGTGPGAANCNSAGGPCSGPCAHCISAIACDGATQCTIIYPTGPSELVVFNITSQTYANCFLDTMTVRSPTPIELNEVYACGLRNINALQNSNCGLRTDINSIEHSTFQNVLWDTTPPGASCATGQFDWFQRVSGFNLWDNNTFGDASGNWYGAYSQAEYSIYSTAQNSTFFLSTATFAGNQTNCGTGFMGSYSTIKNNTVNELSGGPNGICHTQGGGVASTLIDSPVGGGFGTVGIGFQAFQNNQIYDSNTVNCNGDFTYICVGVTIQDTQATNNHIFNPAGSSPASLLGAWFGLARGVNWSNNDFHFSGAGNGIQLVTGGNINGAQINGNSFQGGTSGSAINVSTGNSSNCSVSNNSVHPNMTVSVSTGSPGCTATGN